MYTSSALRSCGPLFLASILYLLGTSCAPWEVGDYGRFRKSLGTRESRAKPEIILLLIPILEERGVVWKEARGKIFSCLLETRINFSKSFMRTRRSDGTIKLFPPRKS